MKLSKEVQELFLKGAQVVCNEIDYSKKNENEVYLLRMPKGLFIKDYRKEYENHFFEYVRLSNRLDNNTLHVTGHRNGTLHDVRKNILNN